jgi:ABC-type maltose transport system permease subunit
MIASVIVTVPAILIFGYLQKYLIAGFTTGAVKG